MNAMNSPIPAAIAFFRLSGMLFTIASLILKKVRRTKIIPSQNIAVSANCHECPIPIQTVYAKNAFRPIPAERAKGRFASSAMTRHAIADAMAVAENTFPNAIPDAERMPGFTARM